MNGSRRVVVVAVLVTLGLLAAACRPPGWGHGGGDASRSDPVAPLSRNGRWWTDATGRIVTLHGVNEVTKSAPYFPAAVGFDDDDAAFLAAHGFNALRLGVIVQGLMPEPGRVDRAYVDHIEETVEVLARHHIFVLLDFHQDGFGPAVNGNGFPPWMTITDGLPNPPDAVFPLYYVQNPALQRAFEHFWANSPGPDGVGLQDAFLRGFRAIVARFATNPWVIGYEPMNEPWPGADWVACSTTAGCPDHEARLLRPFYARTAAVVHELAPRQVQLVEPFVLFNFGQGPTTVPGLGDPRTGLSFHTYALDPASEQRGIGFAVDAAERQQVPLLATEFGATTDAPALDRLTGFYDDRVVSWIDWTYESLIARAADPAGLDNLTSLTAFTALVRPAPLAVAGTPTRLAFDPATRVLDLEYSTTGPDGRRVSPGLLTSVSVPSLRYPAGSTVTAVGARVVSRRCAPVLLLRTDPHAASVSVRVAPGGGCS